ncbi:MAG: homocysteine S-methyltransferase family protein [Christensenellales bacterium]
MDVNALLQQGPIVLDGAMGTMLQNAGLPLGQLPETYNLLHPEIVTDIHRQYLQAGARVVLANTFGANAHKLAGSGVVPEEAIAAGVRCAKKAAKAFDGAYVGLDIGPIGELLFPMGQLAFDEAYELFAEQVEAGVKAGADAIFIETMTDLYEAKAAVLAAKEHSSLPVFCTMSFEKDGRTFTGCQLSAMALTLSGLGVDGLGMNCSVGPVEMLEMAEEILRYTDLPLIIKPNAGLPEIVDGRTRYSITREEFVEAMQALVRRGAAMVGGCCGTDPGYIRALAEAVRGITPKRPAYAPVSAVCSHAETVVIDRVRPIGERINPTGKKRMKQALQTHEMAYLVSQGLEQVEAGAKILDVNVGLPGLDEAAMMVEAVQTLQSVLTAPLQIDSSHPEVLEQALRAYNGVPIVNSVNGEEAVLRRILPMVKKYGACVVGLTLDETGIPRRAEDRLKIARRILAEALRYGIPKERVFIDCLVLTASAEQEAAYETLDAVRMVHEELGLKTVLGVSNISFGLPQRGALNQTFLALALANGLDLPILNPNVSAMMDTIFCYHQLKNLDIGSRAYIERFANRTEDKPAPLPKRGGETEDIAYCILKGLKEPAAQCAEALLAKTEPLALVQETLIPALDEVGQQYEKGVLFLPQLLASADAAKACFERVRAHLQASGADKGPSRGRILMATVKGDIHDIGKNIVKVVLENYGYEVIDLGRDVPVQTVVEAARETKAPLVGLSALMTTTVASMKETIEALKAAGLGCRTMVGGAVLTQEYADEMGADFYAADVQASVAIAREVFGA